MLQLEGENVYKQGGETRMIKKVLTICYRFGEYCWSYVEEFLFPLEINPTKVTDATGTSDSRCFARGARNNLAAGHRLRGDIRTSF